ncbi:uncharacterized protein C11orf98 homolog isoform X2 [Phyllopteryx taeniolatus]|uniref:uncharacterized protein C11orf98 homolog isoform X2 n=1 Tax=Phyllopteryx taeniolatus TaxID=161469 RepID=UPI002AD4EAEB|nr:uncharacterized protein C11orf98 homolog isoform X2 [Phyllopteryx taeniolatus]
MMDKKGSGGPSFLCPPIMGKRSDEKIPASCRCNARRDPLVAAERRPVSNQGVEEENAEAAKRPKKKTRKRASSMSPPGGKINRPKTLRLQLLHP